MSYAEQKTKMVVYWDCGAGHEHRSRDAAEKCGPHGGESMWSREKKKRLARLEKDKQMLFRVLAGETYANVGREFGVCGNRVHAAIMKMVGKAKRGVRVPWSNDILLMRESRDEVIDLVYRYEALLWDGYTDTKKMTKIIYILENIK